LHIRNRSEAMTRSLGPGTRSVACDSRQG
jgi:hypothetical protein